MTRMLTAVVLIALAGVTIRSQTPTFSSRVKAIRVQANQRLRACRVPRISDRRSGLRNGDSRR